MFGGTAATGGAGTFDSSLAPYVTRTPIHWMFDIEIDPADSRHAMFTTGYGGWETFNLTDMDANQPTRWSVMATGIEETVPLDLCSPTKGAHLISAVGDYGGFTHWDLDKPAPEGASEPPLFNNTRAWLAPRTNPRWWCGWACRRTITPASISVTRSMAARRGNRRPPCRSRTAAAGSIAVSADGATWVWTLQGAARMSPGTTAPRGRWRRGCRVTRAWWPTA